MKKEEGHYDIKRVDALPLKGNSNWLYLLKTESPIENFYRWDGSVYETLPISSLGINSVVGGTSITVDNTDPSNPIINSSGGGATTIVSWAGTTAYEEGELAIKPDVDNGVVIRRLAAGTSDATWASDYTNWEYVSQREILLEYTLYSNQTKMKGEKMWITNVLYQCNLTDQTRAGFDGLEQTDWDAISAS